MRKLYLLLITVFFAAISNAQIGVTVTGNTNTTPNLSASYPSLSTALTALNAVTAMTGPVTFTLAAGTSETAPATGFTIGSATLNPVLSATNTVTIVKGAGGPTVINAGVGTATPASAAPDGMLKLTGADYITIDGLTFTDGNATNPATMEFGVALFKLSASDGCNNNTIQNCIFNMQRINNAGGTAPMQDGSIGILVINSTATAATTSLTPTNGGTLATNGTNSGNKFYANTINGGNIGIGLSGYAASAGVGPNPTATTFLGDLNNDIGGSIVGNGNSILNYGGGGTTSPAAGIRANNQWSVNIRYNIINNNNGGGTNHATTLRGIYGQAGTSANANISNNTITIKCGATTSSALGIENAIGSTAAANTLTITNNTIQNCTYSTGTSATFSAISNTASAATVNITNNIIQNNTFTGATTTGTFNAIINSGTNTTTNLNNNQVLNNTIGTSGTASSCSFFGIYCSASSTNYNALSNTISGNILANSYGSIYCIRGSTSTIVVDGNTISNNTIPNNSSTSSSLIYGYYDVSSPVNETITNNNINNLSMTGNNTSTSNTIYGIYNVTAAGTKIFTGNNINNLNYTSSSTGSASVIGIRNAYTTTSTIAKNVIHTLSSTGTTPLVAGIYLGSSVGTTYNVYNNLIGNLTTPQSTGFNLYGIFCGSIGTNINLYYNTVYLNGTSSGSGFASSAVYMSSTTPTVTLNNNLLVNLSTATGTGLTTLIRRTSTVLTTYGSTSNNNLFYAGTPSASNLMYYDGTNSYQTLASFKAAVSPRESGSFTEVVSSTPGVFFQSLTGPASGSVTTFLHLVNGLPTQAESGGAPVGSITDDYDGDARNATTPDIGADEFNGVFVDLAGPTITYTPLAGTCSAGDKVLNNVTITDVTGVPTSGSFVPRIYYKKNNGSYFSQPGSLSSGTSQNGVWSFTIVVADMGGIAPGDKISYYVIAQDLASTPNISSSPSGVVATDVNTVTTHPSNPNLLYYGITSGTFTVGVGGNFTTLTDAVGAYNAGCIAGPIVFNLTDATYPSETFPITINAVAGASAVNTLTIKPASGVSPTITGNAASNAVIRINGNYVTIDGSNNGSTSRDLTITNSSTTSPSVVVFGSSGTTPITNNTLKNCIIINGAQTATAVVVSDVAIGTAGYFNNITIQNNSIQRAYIGVYSIAAVLAGNGSGLLVTQNDLNTSGANSIRLIGLYAQGVDGATLSNNNIGNMANTLDASNLSGIWLATATVNTTVSGNNITSISGTSAGPRGIAVSTGTAASNIMVSGNTITSLSSSSTVLVAGVYVFSTTGGVTMQTNKIRDIKNTNSTSTASYGINLAATGANFAVINNFISDVASYGSTTSTSNGMGIALTAAGTNYTIYYNSVWINSDQTLTTGIPSAINITSSVTAAGTVNIRNNIFSNTATVGTDKYAIYSGAANTVFAASGMDYNDYWSSGSNLGFIGSNRSNLAAIQAGFGQNTNSTNIQPVFMTNSDLHLNPGYNPTLNNTGIAIGGITTDIDGDSRTGPDVGADEFTPCSPPATATASSNSPVCEGSTLSLTGTTNGSVFSWTGPNGFASSSQNPSIPTVTLAAAGTYTFQAFLAGCPSLASTTTVVVNPKPTISSVTATPSTVCFNSNTQLNVNAVSNMGYTATSVPFAPIGSGSGTVTLASAGAATTALTSGTLDDGYWNNLSMPFSFSYYGTSYSTINVQTNGIVSFSPFTTTTGYSSSPQMPNTAVPNNIIGVFGDMDWGFGGVVSYYTSGSAPNRIFVINYNGTTGGGFYNSGSAPTALVNFQIQLFENGSKIQIHTTSITTDASHNHTMGIENSGGTVATVIAGRNNSLWSLTNDGVDISAGSLTYAWSPATFLNNTTISNPLASNVTATTVYTVTVTDVTGCAATGTVTVTIDPANTYTVTGGGSYCPGGSGVLVGLSNSDAGINYQLQLNGVNTGSPVAGTGTSISFGNQTGAGTYTVIAVNPSSSCTRQMTGSVVVSIYPTPDVTPTPASQSSCSGSAITTIALTGSVSGTTYTWTRDNTGSVTGIAASGSGDISGSLTNTTNAPITVTFTITPSANGCTGPTSTATVTVNPTPDVVATPSSQSVCTGSAITTIVLSSSVSGTTYTWTRDNTGTVTGIGANGSGNISGTLTNTTASPITVTFTITPSANGCAGPSTTATVTVNPLPSVPGSVTQPTTCVSADGAIDITPGGTPGPYTYFWSTVGGSGLVPTAQDQTGLTIGQYTVVVTDQTTGCQQTAVFNLVGPGGCSVCPVIGALSTTPSPAVCAGSNLTLDATSLAFMGVTYGITFKYSSTVLADPYVGGTILGTVGNGSLGGGGTTASLNTNIPTAGSYYVYAILSPIPIDPSCRPSAQATITVNPIPGVNPITSQTFCNTTPVPTGTFNFSSNVSGTFNGKILIAYADVSGAPTTLQSNLLALPGVTQVDLFDANAGTPTLAQMLNYGIVVPFSNSPYADPVAMGNNLADYVDANGTVVGLGFTFYISPYGPTGRWVTGNYSPYNASSNLDFAVHTLGTYNAGHPLMAGVTAMSSNYHNIVTVAAGGTEVAQWDDGSSLVAFKGRVVGITAYIGTVATWSGDFAKVIVNAGNWLGGGGTVTFNWTNNNTTIGLGASGTGNSLPAFTATNAGNAPVTATISVTASYTFGGATCTGSPATFTITVNPTPTVNAVSNQTVCNGAPTTAVNFSGAVAGTVYSWTNNTPSIGLAASGTGNIGSFNAINAGTTPVVATITVTPSYTNGGTTCTGAPVTFTITVNPTPNAVATPSSQTICSGSAITTIALSGAVSGTTYTWTRNNTGTVTGIAASGSGNISGTLTNTTNAPVTVTFTITPSANGCAGPTTTATVLVNPTPNAVATPSSQTVCSGSPMTTIVLSGNVAGTTYSWTRNNTVNVTGIPNSGTGNISGTPVNNTAVQQTVIFTITPTANGCPGTPITATMILNLGPTITCPANITVNNTPGQCGAIVNYPPATVSGSPAPVVTYSQASGTFFPVGTTTVTATATNSCGTASCSFTITVVDNQPPTIVCPSNITVNNAPGVCGATVTYPYPTVNDNCGLPGGTNVVMNQSTNSTTITPIQIGCQYAGGITAENSWWRAYNMANYSLPAGIVIKSVSFGIEKITGGTVPITARIYRQTSGTFPAGTRTLLATQTANFNVQTATFQSIIFSTPAAASPTDVIIVELYCPDQLATGRGFFIGSNALPETGPSYISAAACGFPNPTDLSDVGFPDDNILLWLNGTYYTSAPTLVQIAGLPSGSVFPVGTTVNTWRATDAAGNTATCSFNVTVVDAQAPSITCPNNIVRNTDPGLCTASIAVPNPTYSDNCLVTQLTWAMTGATVASSPATGINFVGTRTFNLNGTTGQGVTTITYTARDAAGNITTCSFTVTVNDAALPVITTQPATRFTCVGSNAVFTVAATAGGGPIAYQWQEWNGTAWVNIAGATTNSYAVNSVTFADNTRSFRVILTGLCSVVNSAAATLYVNPLPTITLLPSIPPILSPAQTLNINAVASPAGGSYAWYYNGVLSASHTGSVWSGITVDGIGSYHVIYTDPNGCVATSADLVVSGQQSDGIWVYPNPNTGHFTVRFFNQPNESITINVYDAKGARVYQKMAPTGTPYTGIDVELSSATGAGVYIVQVVNGSGKIIGARRIIVRHP